MSTLQPLTGTDLLAQASQVLVDNGYKSVETELPGNWSATKARIFEDPYSIVAVIVYDTWTELNERWPDAQDTLVSVISQYVSKGEAKAWEGYLVLMTPAPIGASVRTDVTRIRYDTNRVRKLVATGGELLVLKSIEQVLLPVLPLTVPLGLEESKSALEMLPSLLAGGGITEAATRILLEAFSKQENLIEGLHSFVAKR